MSNENCCDCISQYSLLTKLPPVADWQDFGDKIMDGESFSTEVPPEAAPHNINYRVILNLYKIFANLTIPL
jgi:hypothetical protein